MSAVPHFIWREGVHLPGTPLWCDARHMRSLCFVSHAGQPLQGQHRQILCTERTFRIFQGGLRSAPPPSLGKAERASPGKTPSETLLTPHGRPFSLGGLRLELFPSGYLPGAASLLVCQRGGPRLVYASDINPGPRPDPSGRCAAEAMQVRAAEALVCHAPLAPLQRPLPAWDEALDALFRHVEQAQGDRAAIVLLVPVLGLAQDLLPHLLGRGLRVHLHRRLHQACVAWKEQGLLQLPAEVSLYRQSRQGRASHRSGGASAPLARQGRASLPGGEVLLWPLDQPWQPLLRLPGPVRLFLCAGAALSADVVARCHRALPPELPLAAALAFPEGADLPALLRLAADTEARDVYLTAGFSPAVEHAMQQRRVRVHPLGPPRQLDLFAEPAPA